MFFFCSILTEPFDISSNILETSQHEIVENVKENINSVYKQIKKTEKFHNLEYLQLHPEEKSNEETTNEQLEKLFSLQKLL